MTRSIHGSVKHSPARARRQTRAWAPPVPLIVDMPDDDDATTVTTEPRSAMRLRSSAVTEERAPASRLLDELTDDDLNLTVSLLCLEQATTGSMPNDPSARAAAGTLAMRIQELFDLRDALHDLVGHARDAAFASLFVPEEPLAVYVKGLYVWATGIADALDELARALRELSPDWGRLRSRLDEASGFYFHELVAKIRRHGTVLRAHAAAGSNGAIGDALEELFWAASWLHRSLEKRFG